MKRHELQAAIVETRARVVKYQRCTDHTDVTASLDCAECVQVMEEGRTLLRQIIGADPEPAGAEKTHDEWGMRRPTWT